MITNDRRLDIECHWLGNSDASGCIWVARLLFRE